MRSHQTSSVALLVHRCPTCRWWPPPQVREYWWNHQLCSAVSVQTYELTWCQPGLSSVPVTSTPDPGDYHHVCQALHYLVVCCSPVQCYWLAMSSCRTTTPYTCSRCSVIVLWLARLVCACLLVLQCYIFCFFNKFLNSDFGVHFRLHV